MGLGDRSHLEAFAAAGRVHEDACCPAGAGDRQGPPTAADPTRSGMAVNVTQDIDAAALRQGRTMHHRVVCPGHKVGLRAQVSQSIPAGDSRQLPSASPGAR